MADDKDACVERHRVMIHDRGGERKLHEITRLNEVNYTRGRSVVGDARVTLSGRSCADQAGILDRIARGVRRYEMVIFRGKVRAFEGPLIQVETGQSSAVLIAQDVTSYLFGTPLTRDYPIETGERRTPADPNSPWLMTERVREIVGYELSTPYQAVVGTGSARELITIPRWENVTPPANVAPFLDIRRSDSLYTRSDTAAMQMSVGEHLANLAEGGLDFTATGRKIIVWDSAEPHGHTRRVTDADFYGELRVIAAGSEHADIGHVSASRPEEPPVTPEPGVVPGVGNAGRPDEFYGVWTKITSLEQEEGAAEPSQDELNSQAQRVAAAASTVPTTILVPDGASMRLSSDLTLDDLVPGVIVPVTTSMNLRPVEQDQRLDKVTVTENDQGETVAVSMTSAGQAGIRSTPRTQEDLLSDYRRRIGLLERRLGRR